jgi:hypothetical protein
LLAGCLAEGGGLQPVFGFCALLSIMAFLWMATRVREPRYTEAHAE